ncbi:hypothetical protein [Kribbella sp. NPDC023855]|uniref:hypothetical protein n=1 Tax=Kribbella sp. NPDC023855 TaxID=3154698 RepID=UPI0033E59389
MNVVLLTTKALPPTYFDTVREELGDPDITLDVIGWVAPEADLDDEVSFTLIGPGTPAPAPKYSKVVDEKLPKAITASKPMRLLRANRAGKELGKAYWAAILSHRDVLDTIDKAAVVVALDDGAIWAGWNLGQRNPAIPAMLGVPAARRELELLKAPAGHG